MIRKVVFGMLGLLLALILIIAGKTLLTTSTQLQVAPEKPVTVDSAAAAARLSTAVKLQTISSATDAEASNDAFKALHQTIAADELTLERGVKLGKARLHVLM